MKKTLTLALLLFGMVLAGCGKKDKSDVEPEALNRVQYILECESCNVTIDVAAGKQSLYVTGSKTVIDNNDLSVINVTATGSGSVKLVLILDDIIKCHETKYMGEPGTATYAVKMR